MARKKDKDLTKADIVPLITRAGFTDVSDQYPNVECAWKDDNDIVYHSTLASAREQLTMKWLIQQNSN